MSPQKKEFVNLKQYNEKEIKTDIAKDEKIRSALTFTISLIYCGFPISLSQDFAILLGLVPPTYYFIQIALEIIRPIIKQLAFESALRERQKMQDNFTVCVDASWDHKRDGKLLIYDVISIELQKIIDFEIIIRKTPKRKGNVEVSPQGMEGEAFLMIFPRLMQNSKIMELVKDGDLQRDHIIASSGWKPKLTPDPNHLLLHFSNNFENLVYPNKRKFTGICKKILKQLKYILYSDTTKEQKFQQIQQMKNHFLTELCLKLGRSLQKHPWKYANDQNDKDSLDKVIDYCNQIVSSFDRGHSTCYNESFHALKGKYLLKSFNLGNSGDIRVYAAVLDYNDGKRGKSTVWAGDKNLPPQTRIYGPLFPGPKREIWIKFLK